MKTLGVLCHRAQLCVLLIVAANAYSLRHELAGGRFELNDSVFHYTLADRTVQAIEPRERTSALVVTGVPDRELHVRAVRLRAMGVVLKADRLTGSLRPFAKSHNGG